MNLITKADFTPDKGVKFSQNIREDQIDPYITLAQNNDFAPKIPRALYAALRQLDPLEPGSLELKEYLEFTVKPFLVLASYYRFIAQHGTNVTQFGLSKTRDPQGTFDQVDAQDRAIILRQVSADMKVAALRLASAPQSFDGVDYGEPAKVKANNSFIRAPKRRDDRRRRGDDYNPYSQFFD